MTNYGEGFKKRLCLFDIDNDCKTGLNSKERNGHIMNIDEILPLVEKPARYVGNELNQVIKDPKSVDIRYAFIFPDVYEIGMSHLGIKLLYHIINERDDAYCERVFSPWPDMEKLMVENGIKLFSLETKTPLDQFDIIGITIQYEMCYTNMINALRLGGVPIWAKDRGEDDPIVTAGGPCTYNPEPFAEFFDIISIGEGEDSMNELLDLLKMKKQKKWSRKEFLRRAADIPGTYVPSLYSVEYTPEGFIKEVRTEDESVPKVITKRIIEDFDSVYYPDKIIVPYLSIVHDRITLEIMRGCTRGCRFCQAGMVYRPIREKSLERLKEITKKLYDSTGYEEISLCSLSSSDYTYIDELIKYLTQEYTPKGVSIAMPSLRLDTIKNTEFMSDLAEFRKAGLTFAPEAGTQRLRDVINKGIYHDDLITACRKAFSAGWDSVKLYFMLGLPTETMEDVEGISNMAHDVKDIYFNEIKGKGRLSISVSASTFVPKPCTPFQWCGQEKPETIREKQNLLRQRLKGRGLSFSWNDTDLSVLEAVFARGDRRLSKALARAVELGCKMDSWDEYFRMDLWKKAFEDTNTDYEWYAQTSYDTEQILPWDHIDCGVSKSYLKREYKKAMLGQTTPDCREKCNGCGLTKLSSACRRHIKETSDGTVRENENETDSSL